MSLLRTAHLPDLTFEIAMMAASLLSVPFILGSLSSLSASIIGMFASSSLSPDISILIIRPDCQVRLRSITSPHLLITHSLTCSALGWLPGKEAQETKVGNLGHRDRKRFNDSILYLQFSLMRFEQSVKLCDGSRNIFMHLAATLAK